jgi:thiamine biosynthesis lipoprotein
VTIANVSSSKYRRPYVAVWIENPEVKNKAVRFLIVWGKELKYQNSLKNFSPLAKFNGRMVDAVTRPTRPPGEYTVTWDGLDDAGKPVPAGDYVVHVEVSREHGTRVHMMKMISCRDTKQEERLDGNLEVTGVVLRFGNMKK